MSLRKFTTEVTLILTVGLCFLGRQQDFAETPLSEEEAEQLHLYVVARRPLVRIRPQSVEFTDDEVRFVVGVQRGESFSESPMTVVHEFGSGATWESEWPHDEFSIRRSDGEVCMYGTVAQLSDRIPGWPLAARMLEVVYVDQAFGKDGERTAWDRLKSHATVQKILAETPRDQQVWIALAAVTDVQMTYETVPGPTATSDDEDNQHLSSIIGALERGDFRDKEAVALAEAGMIRYFQPQYNDRLKHRFPARKSVPLKTVRGLDVHGLIVEIQSDAVGNLIGTPMQKASMLHFAGFAIHVDDEREVTLALQSVAPKSIPASGGALSKDTP